jgi:hypothetical protein
MVEKLPSILVLPGIQDDVSKIRTYVAPLEQYFAISVSSANWQSNEPIEDKIQRVRQEIDEIEAKGIIGVSASGHIGVTIATKEDMKEISGVAAISAPLKRGEHVLFRSKQVELRRPRLYESLTQFEEKVFPAINQEVQDKIITTRGTHDWTVPPNTSFIEGATNIVVPSNRFNPFNHMANIIKGLQSSELVQFLLEKIM